MHTLAVPELIEPSAPSRRRASRHWRRALLALAVGAVLYGGWQLARPLVADKLAEAVAPAQEFRLGQGLLQELDVHTLAPSALSETHQWRISSAFAGLQAPHEGAPRHRLLFRSGHVPAAAFTLPSGDIVLTDALVLALPDDGAVLAVLAHELGHLHRRHMLRRLVGEAMLPAMAGIALGDSRWLVSSMAARAPQLAWHEREEIEADGYAADLLEHNGLSLRSLEEARDALSGAHGVQRAYQAVHPHGVERQARLRERAGH